MRPSSLTDPQRVLKSLLGLLACVVLAAIVSNEQRQMKGRCRSFIHEDRRDGLPRGLL